MTMLEQLRTSAPATPTTDTVEAWVDVCPFADLQPDRGVAALVHGVAIAVFRCWPDDDLYAIANIDPFSGASVLSRGIVGSIGDRAVVASPVFKHHFDLRTGVAFEDPSVATPCYPVRVVDGVVQVGARPLPAER
jgi:nitrite reductase (NADH) small subunit